MKNKFYVIALLSFALVACEQNSANQQNDEKLTSTPNNKTKEISKTSSDKALQFSKDGFKDIVINQKFQYEKLKEIKDSRLDDCYYATSLQYPKLPIDIQIIDNKIAVVSTREKTLLSYTGVRVGDNENVIYQKHKGEKFEKVMNPYGDFKTQYSIIYWYNPQKKQGTRYDIENNKVIEIYVGNENLELMEGCA